MNVNITFKHMDSSPATADYARQKLGAAHERYFPRESMDVDATFEVEKLRHIAHLHANVAGARLDATAENDEMHAAIDEVVARLERQLHDLKEKRRAH